MKILHLFSNWKWTGPAEPALNACVADRESGLDARFASGQGPNENTVNRRARERGLEPVLTDMVLSKHRRILSGWKDTRRLHDYLTASAIDVVHAHLPNAHQIAIAAARALPHVRVVRTHYDHGLIDPRREAKLLRRTDALLAISQATLDEVRGGLGYPADRSFPTESTVDLDRFCPSREFPDARAALGVPADAYLVGIVARMQRHRRFDVLLDAIDLARRELPGLRVVVIGRGTHQDEIAKDPAKARGLDDVITFAGYLCGDEYVGAVAALDAKLFLVPGSDGSCRAVREAMALGVPVIAARRGMLAEIVRDGETGIVVDDAPEHLAAAIVKLGTDAPTRKALGEAALAYARERFSMHEIARRRRAVYEAVCARPPVRPSS